MSSPEASAANQLVEAIRNKRPVEELLQVLEASTDEIPGIKHNSSIELSVYMYTCMLAIYLSTHMYTCVQAHVHVATYHPYYTQSSQQ